VAASGLERGYRDTLAALLQTLLYPLVRYRRRIIWEARLTNSDVAAPERPANERLIVLGPENLEAELTPGLFAFLGGDGARSEIEGVRAGDRLFVVAEGTEYIAYSYIFFETTAETRRQARILGENPGTPIIGLSFTAEKARGRGIYRRILAEMFRFLEHSGYGRAVCEVEAGNAASNRASRAAGMQVCRELSDWRIAGYVMVQKMHYSGNSRWRVFRV
jgi:RimJ/RimL family protein N-acetyltransferase